MNIDLTKLSTPVLKEIRRILVDGIPASAGVDSTAKHLKKELAGLKKLNSRWQLLQDAEIDDVFDYSGDKDYILSFSDNHFDMLINKLIEQKREAQREVAIADKTRSMRVPPLFQEEELSSTDIVRAAFNELKNRNNGHRQLDE